MLEINYLEINYEGYIGYTKLYSEQIFSSTDSAKLFYKNSIEQGADWEYASLSFTYTRNSFGHRCKEYTELDFDNYILCTGCSFVEGIGIPEEKRWSNVLANKLNCDLYNLGIAGSGNDTIFFNLVNYFTKSHKLPKFVIISWTDYNRFFTFENNTNNIIKYHSIHQNELIDFFVQGNQINYFESKSKTYKQILKNIIKIPIIEIDWTDWNESEVNKNTYNLQISKKLFIDRGRDLMHPGIKTNQNIAESIHKFIMDNYI